MNPQEHIPGPRFPIPDDYRVLRIGEIIEDGDFVVIKSKKAFDTDRPIHPVSVGNAVTAQDFDFHFFFRPLPPDPERIPSKPGGEAAAPLDAQDGELVKKAEISLPDDLRYWRAERPDEWIMDRFIKKADSLISEVASLRESVASLTRERDEALKSVGRFTEQCATLFRAGQELGRIAEERTAERDAMRKALEAARHELTALHGLTATDDPHAYGDALAEGLDANAASECEAEASFKINTSKTMALIDSALSPTPSPKEAQNG